MESNSAQQVVIRGQEHWEMFVAIPAENASMAPILNREIVRALTAAGFIDQTKDQAGRMSSVERLATVPRPDLFLTGK
jgi:hypothetical protein